MIFLNMQDIVKNISPDEIDKFYKLCSTVGAYDDEIHGHLILKFRD